MTTRSNRPVPTAVAWGTPGGTSTPTVAVAEALWSYPGCVGGHIVLVDFDSRAFDALGPPLCEPQLRVAARRSPIGAG